MNQSPPQSHLAALYGILDFHTQLKEKEADEDKVWSRVVDKLAVALDAEAATYFSYLPAKRHLLPRYALGEAAYEVSKCAVDIRTGICGWVASHREPVTVGDAYGDQRFFKDVDGVTHFHTKSVLAVPLLDRLELSGVIEFLNKRSGLFTEDDLRLAVAACRATSLALRNLRLENAVDRITSNNANILENLSGGFIAIDTHGRIIICNPAAKRILSLGKDIPLDVPAEQVLVHVPRIVEVLNETLATRQVCKRQEFQWKLQGQTRTLGYSTLLIQDPQGNMTGAGLTFQDITEHQR
ncbi:MAG: GAF domain-containing protein [Elusimicrobiota bacterium]|jgi:PAS domain S-box-containing protein